MKAEAHKDEKLYAAYFKHNNIIVEVLSLFSGFLFTSITIILAFLQDRGTILAQATIFFLVIVLYFSLYVLLDNLEMGFHYIENIPPLTLQVRPFFNLVLVFYLFGTATIMMFFIFNLIVLAIVSGVVWIIFVMISVLTTVRRFYNQSITRYWKKEPNSLNQKSG